MCTFDNKTRNYLLDKILLEQANQLNYTDWVVIDEMVKKAYSLETKIELKRIEKKLYHAEENSIGLM